MKPRFTDPQSAMVITLAILGGSVLTVPATVTPASADTTAQVTIEPTFVYLGTFSGYIESESDPLPGDMIVSILSDVDWQLEVAAVEPFTRVDDGLELPSDRWLLIYPGVSQDEYFEPHVAMDGQGSSEWFTHVENWQRVQSILQDYLSPEDPPGRYRTRFLCRLTTPEGHQLAEPIEVVAEFDVDPWIELVTLDESITFQVDWTPEQGSFGESDVYGLAIIGNSGWSLSASLSEPPAYRGNKFPELDLFIGVVPPEPGDTWNSQLSDFTQLTDTPLKCATGVDPYPFAQGTETVYVQFQLNSELLMTSGTYYTSVHFDVAVQP